MTPPLWIGNGLAWAAQAALLVGAGLLCHEARQWRFEPGRVDGKVAPVNFTLTIRFLPE